ncbi:MAG: serine hydrolase domain-containing protein, partial [Ginsengibacter sp.]
LLYFFISSGCNSQANKVVNTQNDSTYVAPKPGYIPPAEFSRYQSEIKNYYENNLVRLGFNGGILVAKKGNIIFEAYHGYSNAQKKDSFNLHSAFHLASVSKTFTAMAILKLAELGKLKLDDDLILYFPAFPYAGVTIKMLLNHRSGLPNYIYFLQELGWDVTKVSTNQDVLDYLIKFKPPITHLPGTRFNYCNTNYALLALLIEKVSGKPFPEFMQYAFFKPLKMNDTYVFTMADSAKAMPSYDWRWRPEVFNFLDGEYGDKNIYSTPRDLLKWDQALYSTQLFDKQTLEEAFTPYSHEKPGIKNYGLGWRMDLYPNGKKIIFHTGWWHGNNSILIHLVEDSATIIVLGNKYNRSVYEAKKLANVFGPYFNIKEEEAANTRDSSLTGELPDSAQMVKLKHPKIHLPARRKRNR